MEQIYDSRHSGQEVDKAVDAVQTTIPNQLAQIGSNLDEVEAEIGYKIDEFSFSAAGEKAYRFVEGNTYVVTNIGNSSFTISIRETKDGESHDATNVGVGKSVEITASIDGYWVRVGASCAFNIILKGNINSRLNAFESSIDDLNSMQAEISSKVDELNQKNLPSLFTDYCTKYVYVTLDVDGYILDYKLKDCIYEGDFDGIESGNGLVVSDNRLKLQLATETSDGAMSSDDKKAIANLPSMYVFQYATKYESVSLDKDGNILSYSLHKGVLPNLKKSSGSSLTGMTRNSYSVMQAMTSIVERDVSYPDMYDVSLFYKRADGDSSENLEDFLEATFDKDGVFLYGINSEGLLINN